MKRSAWLLLAFSAFLMRGSPAHAAAQALGSGPAYETLGRLAVLHQGRYKPLDTMARQLIKQICGAESITLRDADGHPVATWGHVGAYIDMSARPEYWDDQPIVQVIYIPLKRMLLASKIKTQLHTIAEHPGVSQADKARIETLAGAASITPEQLAKLAQETRLAEPDRKVLAQLGTRLGSENRWLSPREIEEAKVTVEGQTVTFESWISDIVRRFTPNSEMGMGQQPKLPELERNARECATALRHYQAIRGDSVRFLEPVDMMMPRPSSATYLTYVGDLQRKLMGQAHGTAQPDRLTPFEENTAQVLQKYLSELPRDDWRVPGTDKAFDARFSAWLREKSDWVPLSVLMQSDSQELDRAGFPKPKAQALQAAYKALVNAEINTPGQVPQNVASTLLTSARDLGQSAGGYPASAAIAREVHFNEFAPFVKATMAYGTALLLLLLSLGIPAEGGATSALLKRWLRIGGLAALLAAIGLEVYGFYFRVRISGWAPVTNMYETVIWVALVASVLGFVLELIFGKTYSALAAAGVSFILTLLAYKVPLLDPNIKNLTPVLRSNYWLAIHVLTIVSSYAAFALAMGLGVIATLFYLTATYRRQVTARELAWPLLWGAPLVVLGLMAMSGTKLSTSAGIPTETLGQAGMILAALGALLVEISVLGWVGEAISRFTFGLRAQTASAAGAGQDLGPAATSVQTVTVSEGSGAIATLSRPTVAEIRARAATALPRLDVREQAMQAAAAQLKPLATFVYRAMQVGVLLVAAGTILGGLWADVSWGRFWGWDPKEVWALITLLVYLVPLHGRFAGWINTFGLVAASVVCFLSVVMAWYGVNFVLGVGLHSYGFTEGGGQWTVMAGCAAVLAVVAAAAYRRSLAKAVV